MCSCAHHVGSCIHMSEYRADQRDGRPTTMTAAIAKPYIHTYRIPHIYIHRYGAHGHMADVVGKTKVAEIERARIRHGGEWLSALNIQRFWLIN